MKSSVLQTFAIDDLISSVAYIWDGCRTSDMKQIRLLMSDKRQYQTTALDRYLKNTSIMMKIFVTPTESNKIEGSLGSWTCNQNINICIWYHVLLLVNWEPTIKLNTELTVFNIVLQDQRCHQYTISKFLNRVPYVVQIVVSVLCFVTPWQFQRQGDVSRHQTVSILPPTPNLHGNQSKL